MNPIVSVIIANYNKATYIVETVSSILNQSYSHLEVIVVDDCSTDKSVAVLEESFNDKRIKIFTNTQNKGANYCRNMGIKNAQGEYVIFIDSDDLMVYDCIENRIKCAQLNPQTDLLVFSMGVFYSQIGDAVFVWNPTTTKPLSDILQHKLPWTIVQPLWCKNKLIELDGFDESFERLQDVELHTRALLDNTLKYKLVGGRPDCYYRIDESRKVFTSFIFLDKWVASTVQYCEKFQMLVPHQYKRFLGGTIFQTFLQILYKYKIKDIKIAEFKTLETHLIHQQSYPLNKVSRFLFWIAKFYNLHFIRIPGVNRILQIAIVRFG